MHYTRHLHATPPGTAIIIREDKQGITRYGLAISSENALNNFPPKYLARTITYWHSTLDELLKVNNLH